MDTLAVMATLVAGFQAEGPVAMVVRPSAACVGERCVAEPDPALGPSVWSATVLDAERVSLTGGRGRAWTMDIDVPVVAPRADLAPLLARTVTVDGVTLRAGLPLERTAKGWRWATSELRGELEVAADAVTDVVVREFQVDSRTGRRQLGAGALLAKPRLGAPVVAELLGCAACALELETSGPWVKVEVRGALAQAVGWIRGPQEYAVFDVSNCAWPSGCGSQYVDEGTRVAWTLDGPFVGHTMASVPVLAGWPAARMPFRQRTPWGVVELFAEYAEWSALDEWYSTLRAPRVGVLSTPDDPLCPSWDTAPEPEVPGLVRLTCAADPERRTALYRSNHQQVALLVAPPAGTPGHHWPVGLVWRGQPVALDSCLLWTVERGGELGLDTFMALSDPFYRLEPGSRQFLVEGSLRKGPTEWVSLADLGEADPADRWLRDGVRQRVQGVSVEWTLTARGTWVDTLCEPGPALDEYGLPIDADGRVCIGPPTGRDRRIQLAFVGDRYVSAFIGSHDDDQLRCATFERRTLTPVELPNAPPGADPASVLIDEATGRVLWCLAEAGGSRVRIAVSTRAYPMFVE